MSWLSKAIDKVLPGNPAQDFTQSTFDKWIAPEHKDTVESLATMAAMGGIPGISSIFGAGGLPGFLGNALGVNPTIAASLSGGLQSWGTGGDFVKGAAGGLANYGIGQYGTSQGWNPALTGAIQGGVSSAISGQDPLVGALTGGAAGYYSGNKPQTISEQKPFLGGTEGIQKGYQDFASKYGPQYRWEPTPASPTTYGGYQSTGTSKPWPKEPWNRGLMEGTQTSTQPIQQIKPVRIDNFANQTRLSQPTSPAMLAEGKTVGVPAVSQRQQAAGKTPSPTGVGTKWWEAVPSNLQNMFSGENLIPTIINTGLGYMQGGTEGALSGLALQALPQTGPGQQYNNLLAAIRGDLSSRQRGMGGGTGAMLAGVAGEEWDKYTDPNRYVGTNPLMFTGDKSTDAYRPPVEVQRGQGLPGWARGAVGGAIDAVGNQYSPMVGAAVGGVQGSLGSDAPPWLQQVVGQLGTGLQQASYAAENAPTGGGVAIGGGTTTTTSPESGMWGEDALRRLMESADYRIDKAMKDDISMIADEMQRRGLRTSGVHQGALTDMTTQWAGARQATANENVLNVYNSFMQWADSQLNRDQQYQMLKYQAELARQQGDNERSNQLYAMIGNLLGEYLANSGIFPTPASAKA